MDSLAKNTTQEEDPESVQQKVRLLQENRKMAQKRADDALAALPKPVVREVESFDVFNEGPAAIEFFEERGFVILKSVLSGEEVEKGTSLFWDHMEKVDASSTIARRDASTWKAANLGGKFPVDGRTGIVSKMGIGQSDYMWFLRSRDAVRKAFELVWGTDDLLCSFDGCGIFRPYKGGLKEQEQMHPLEAAHFPSDWRTAAGWYHVDQGYKKKGRRHAVQGLVTLTDADETTGGLTLMDRSIHLHTTFMERHAKYIPFDFIKIPSTDGDLQKGEFIQPKLRKGDMVLWDSRTVHCNNPAAAPKEDQPLDRLLRLVAYICMCPAEGVGRKVLDDRVGGYEYWQTTTHWPNNFVPTEGSQASLHGQRSLQDAERSIQRLVVGNHGEPRVVGWFRFLYRSFLAAIFLALGSIVAYFGNKLGYGA